MGRRRWIALALGVAACAPFTTGGDGAGTNATADAGSDALAAPDVVVGDGGATDPRDAASDAAAIDASRDAGITGPLVFVTSTTTTGAMGGVAAADARCRTLAMNANLASTNFVAWLSTSTVSAADHVTGNGPWYLPKADGSAGTAVAAKKATLLTGVLIHPIDVDEKGNAVPSQLVWTGTTSAGADETTQDCSGWLGNTGAARVGTTSSAASSWTFDSTGICGAMYRVYCFQID